MRRFGPRAHLTLKGVVADNLRRLCENDGRSIAYMCRAMRISRSQFDRYLNAENLPTEGTAKTIANFFRVADVDLFQVGFKSNTNMPTAVEEAYGNLTYLPAPRFPIGVYFMFFELASDRRKVMCSVVSIKQSGDDLGFVRLTGYSKYRYASGSYFRGRHSGIIVERHKWLFFAAVNVVPDYDPSMIMIRWLTGDEDALPGKASVMTERGPQMLNVVLKRAPEDLSIRHAVKQARTFSLDSPFITDDVRRYLEENPV